MKSEPIERLSRHLVDPELLELADSFPDSPITMKTLPAMRKRLRENQRVSQQPPSQIERRTLTLPAGDGKHRMPALLYQRRDLISKCPAFLHIHGGGMVAGSMYDQDERNLSVCSQLGITVLSIDYRLSIGARTPLSGGN